MFCKKNLVDPHKTVGLRKTHNFSSILTFAMKKKPHGLLAFRISHGKYNKNIGPARLQHNNSAPPLSVSSTELDFHFIIITNLAVPLFRPTIFCVFIFLSTYSYSRNASGYKIVKLSLGFRFWRLCCEQALFFENYPSFLLDTGLYT